MDYVLLAVLIAYSTAQNLLCEQYSAKYPGKPSMATPVFTVVSGAIVALVSFIMCKFAFSASVPTLILGGFNAIAIYLYNYFVIKSNQTGPYSIMMVFCIAGNIIVPAIVDTLFFEGHLSLVEIACIAVIIVAVYLMSVKKDSRAIGKGYWFAIFGVFVANGAYCSILSSGEKISGISENEELLIITYGGSALLSLVGMIFASGRRALADFKQTTASGMFMVSCALVISGGMLLLTYLLSRMDTTILYMLQCSSVMLLSVVAARVLLKEKLSVKNIIGCALMCAALVVITLFG